MSSGTEIQAFRNARKLLRSIDRLAAVEDVFYGARYRDGVQQPELSIRFHVREKLPMAALPVSERIPRRIGGIRTDVTAIRRHRQVRNELPFSQVRPLLGGIQIQSGAFSQPLDWGTLGCVLRVKDDQFCITNHHVVFDGPSDAGPAPVILQPKMSSFGERIGTGSATLADAEMDYALFRPSRAYDRQQHLNGLAGILAGYRQATGLNELKVSKSGAASGVTHGIYDGRSLVEPHRVSIGRHPGGAGQRLSAPGDSGSVWVCAGEQPGVLKLFALHTGGDDDGNMAFATLFSSIMPSLNARLNNL